MKAFLLLQLWKAVALVTKAEAGERLSSSNPTNDVCNFIQYSRDNYNLDRVVKITNKCKFRSTNLQTNHICLYVMMLPVLSN